MYGLVVNLGSLVVRTLFAPLEDVAFAAFSRWVGSWVRVNHGVKNIFACSCCRWVAGWFKGLFVR